MKQFLLLFLLLVVTKSQAQVIYSQDFSNGVDDMIFIDNDKRTPAADVAANYSKAWNIVTNAAGDNTLAISNSWYTPAGQADDWMITPVVSGISEKTILSWSAFALDPNYPNGYQVLVSPTGGSSIADFTEVVFETDGEEGDPTLRIVQLGDYSGKNIRIAFRDNSDDKFLLAVDDIVVKSLKDVDAVSTQFTNPRYLPIGSTVDVSYVITNNGFANIKSFNFDWNNGTSMVSESVTGIDVPFGESYTGEVSFKIIEAKKYDLSINITSVNGVTDEDLTNNSLTSEVIGVSQAISKKLIAEEATGTWCGWCPRGAVFLDKMIAEYPDDFIGIAVHNGDPMAFTAYDNGIKNLPGFGGFPSMVINREQIIDPEDIEDYFNQVNRKQFAPAIVTTDQIKSNRKITISGEIEFFTNLTDADYSVVAVIVEDEVKGTAATYAQANYYSGGNVVMGGFENLPDPVPAASMTYQEVGRFLPFGFAGKATIIPDTIKSGDVFLFSVDYTAPTAYKIQNIHSVVMVVDNKTGAIVNGGKTVPFRVGVEDIQELNHVAIFPNPSSGVSYIDVELNTSSLVSVKIQNNVGQLMATRDYGQLTGNQILPVNTSGYVPGIYFVSLVINGKISTHKLVVE